MRKILSITILTLLGLVGCGGSNTTNINEDYNLSVSIEINNNHIYANEYVTFYAINEEKTTTTYRWLLNGEEVDGNKYKLRQGELGEGNYTLEVFINDTNGKSSQDKINFEVVDANYSNDTITFFNHLNEDRTNMGVAPLKLNYYLGISALNHAKYGVYNDITGHDEVEGNIGFTGITPFDRMDYVGYKSGYKSEVIGYGSSLSAYEGLMSAIYHRFGMINPLYSEFNVQRYSQEGINTQPNVGNLGNYSSSELYDQANRDSYININEKMYLEAPKYMIYPYDKQIEVPVVFYEENPDPLPDYHVSGYPISMQLNEYKIDMDNSSNFVFELYKGNEKIDTMLITSENDVNERFSKTQFALFAKKPLDYNSEYQAIFKYIENGDDKIVEWSFKTKHIDNLYPLNSSGVLDINTTANSKYIISIPQNYILYYSYTCKNIQLNHFIVDNSILEFITNDINETCYYKFYNDDVVNYTINYNLNLIILF